MSSDLFGKVKTNSQKKEQKEIMENFRKQMYDFTAAAEHINNRLEVIEKWLTYLLSKDEEFVKRHAQEEQDEKPEQEKPL